MTLIRRLFIVAICVCAFAVVNQSGTAQAQQGSQDWDRFYPYPYVTYPQNYWGNHYSRSRDSLYHRYPAEARIPVYNKSWHNYYPGTRRYHFGHHFLTDVF